MKYLPKSKLAAIIAGLYLLPVFFLLYVSIFGGGGLHGSGAMAGALLIILASPLSWFVVWIVDVLPLAKQFNGFIMLGGVVFCAFINATVIYLVVGWLSRKVVEYFGRLGNLMKQTLLLITVLTLCSINGLAQIEKFESIEAFLKATLNSEDKVEFEAKGDLNGDGLADWAGIIQRKKVPPFRDEYGIETDKTVQLYILLQQKQGGYQIAGKSKESGIFGIGSVYPEALEIKNSSVYLQMNTTAHAWFFQFRTFKGEWRLVGFRDFKLELESDKSLEKDRNLLMGTVIEKRQTGERKPTFKRYKKKFPRVLLKDFDLFVWDEIE